MGAHRRVNLPCDDVEDIHTYVVTHSTHIEELFRLANSLTYYRSNPSMLGFIGGNLRVVVIC